MKSLRWIFHGLFGLLLLPLAFGLTSALFELLVQQQVDSGSQRALGAFLAGALLHLLAFLLMPKPFRSYVLAHELSHLIAAWLSGERAGKLKVGRDGGSVEVGNATLWIALAPYILPFYTLLLLLGTALAGLWLDLDTWMRWFPALLGFTWSYHLCYTLLALSLGQSDLEDMGPLGAYPVIYIGNLLFILAGLLMLLPGTETSAALRMLLQQAVMPYHFLYNKFRVTSL